MSGTAARRSVLHWIVPSLGSTVFLLAVANALFFRRESLFRFDGDVGRHIRVGRTILESGRIPRTDLFSHTRRGSHFVPYEWLSEALTALADGMAGLAGPAVLGALLFAVAVFGVYRAADELGAPRLLAFLVACMALLLQSIHLMPRPHLYTTALASVFLLILLRFARSGRPWTLAPLPVLMLFWANLHGGFLIGFVLLIAFVAGALLLSPEFAGGREAVRPLVTILLLSVAASLVNPAGVDLWRHTTGYLGIDFLVDATYEYRSPDFHAGYGKVFLVALLAGPAMWMTGRVRVSPLAAALYLFFVAASLHSARNIPLFTVASLPWLTVWVEEGLRDGPSWGPGLLKRLTRFEEIDRQLRPGAAALVGLALFGYALGPGAKEYAFDDEAFPVEAVRLLNGIADSGPVFNQMAWGGYLLYARPDIPVFIDGQTDFYGEEISREYLGTVKGHAGWREVLDRHGISWTLTRRGEPINQLLALDPEWDRVYEDDVAVVYRRGP